MSTSMPKTRESTAGTDLLLGTQGWRRFALMDLAKFIETNGDEARRVVALKIQSQNEMKVRYWQKASVVAWVVPCPLVE